MSLADRLAAYARLVRFDKPIGTLLLLWPTLWALWLCSDGVPDWKMVGIFIAGTFLMRSAGCAINDYADRNFDPHVKRTRQRPLAAGVIEPWEALAVAAVLSGIAFILVLQLNKLTVVLSFAALFLAASYPFTKRFLALPQAYLGVAFGFGIPMAYAAQTGQVAWTAGILLLANVFWAVAYDTEYAMVDRDDDITVGIRTSAILFGRYDVAMVMLFHGLFILALAVAGWAEGRGSYYVAGLLLTGILAAWQYRWIRDRSRDGCFRAFRHNNWVGGVVFAGIVADYSLTRMV
ncbi:MAG: 4-hydroxybenzoate octaprenyltransferase [Betaproteobacteria bacterium]|jgi:4-hydroxybenzoate polyprenyltransferase|nr:MAG: 4-hydroxybenzoate octaprenyltransferase [Betaproteobacteria bacterium]